MLDVDTCFFMYTFLLVSFPSVYDMDTRSSRTWRDS